MKAQEESFHLNGHIIGFCLQTQKLRVTLQNSIKHSGSERVNWLVKLLMFTFKIEISRNMMKESDNRTNSGLVC